MEPVNNNAAYVSPSV